MSSSTPLNSFRVRPRFSEVVPYSREETKTRLLAALRNEPADTFELRPFAEFIGIHLAERDRRYFSPRLFLSLNARDNGTTEIEGLYGPEIEVWSVFLYGYLATGMLGTLSGIYGAATLFIGDEPWAFYVTGTMAAIALTLYLAAQLGQKLGAHQTCQLHRAYERAAAPLRVSVTAPVGTVELPT